MYMDTYTYIQCVCAHYTYMDIHVCMYVKKDMKK